MPPVYDIFLSYNSQDREAVREVHEALKRRGFRPWIDFEAFTPGRVWQEEAEEEIKTCRAAAAMRAEVHWFEAHGRGRYDIKVKRFLR